MGHIFFKTTGKRRYYKGERTKQIYRLGDKVFVQVLKTDSMTRSVDFRFVTEEEFYKDQGSLVTLRDEE